MSDRHRNRLSALAGIALAGAQLGATAQAAPASAGAKEITRPCRIEGMANELQCGSIKRPLNPAEAQGTQIDTLFRVAKALGVTPGLLLDGGTVTREAEVPV